MLDKLTFQFTCFAFSLAVSISAFSQIRTSSPFSRYGMGIIEERTTAQNKSFGNSGIGLRDGRHVNFMNPASYSAADTLSFTFETGFSTNSYLYQEKGQEAKSTTNGMGYLCMSFPVTRWWGTAVGILPFSNVGYNIKNDSELATIVYSGDGGQNQLIWGNSFELLKYLSIGLNSSYVFGKTYYYSQTQFDRTTAYETQKTQVINVTGFLFDAGLQFYYNFNKKSSITAGLVYSFGQNLKYKEVQTVHNVINNVTFGDSTLKFAGNSYIPSKIGFGLSYMKKNKMLASVDFYSQNWTNSEIFGDQNQYLGNEMRIGGGIEFIPSLFAAKGYHKRISYKVGAYYKNTNINVTDPVSNELLPVTDFGITFGLDLPFRKNKNSIGVSAQLGQKGTTSSEILTEKYLLININIALRETWFYQRKIN